MAWRGVHLTHPARLSVRDAQLQVATDADVETVSIPLEDLAFLVIDTPQAVLSSALLAKIASNGTVLIQCDEKHLPVGSFLPLGQHWKHGEIYAYQDEVGIPFKKRCWQKFVQAKINNQAMVLKSFSKPMGAKKLTSMIPRVLSGDTGNVEARAARVYWSCLFEEFIRSDEADLRNICLNYGYAIVRSLIARQLVASGLQPHKGLHHRSITNAFNLADDLIEPFRPFVDRKVVSMISGNDKIKNEFDRHHRGELSSILFTDCKIGDQKLNLLNGIERVVESVRRAIQNKDAAELLFPELE